MLYGEVLAELPLQAVRAVEGEYRNQSVYCRANVFFMMPLSLSGRQRL
jgi:hypothetical protein